MGGGQHGLFTQVARPVRLYLLHILVSVLRVPLRINVIPLSRLQGSVPIALDLQVRVSNDDRTLWVVEFNHGSRDQEIAQLHLE